MQMNAENSLEEHTNNVSKEAYQVQKEYAATEYNGYMVLTMILIGKYRGSHLYPLLVATSRDNATKDAISIFSFVSNF